MIRSLFYKVENHYHRSMCKICERVNSSHKDNALQLFQICWTLAFAERVEDFQWSLQKPPNYSTPNYEAKSDLWSLTIGEPHLKFEKD